MKTNTETERDTIAWFRVGIVVLVALVGFALFVSGARPAAYFFLGYALFAAAAMLVFKTWRSSSELEKVYKSHWKRMIRDIPRGIFRFFLGFVAFVMVMAIGLIPGLLISNEFYQEHERLLTAYAFFWVGVSMTAFLWVGGIADQVRQIFSDIKALRDAAGRAKERRARQQRKQD